MEIFGIAIGVLGLVLTVVLSDFVIKHVSTRYRDFRAKCKWNADRQVDKGQISHLDNYAFERWYQLVDVDSEGNATHIIEARIVNCGSGLLESITFPIYCDHPNVPESYVSPWARVRRRNLNAKIVDYIRTRSRGRVLVSFDPPVAPGHDLKFHWGYKMPHTFEEGDEYYNYDAANEFNELIVELRFSSDWKILYARWGEDYGQTLRSPLIKGTTIIWRARFPGLGRRVQMKFGLSKPTMKKANKALPADAKKLRG